jgi:hypothetical protein
MYATIGVKLLTISMMVLQPCFLLQKGLFMYLQTSPRRVWDDIGWKAPPAIIPCLRREGN